MTDLIATDSGKQEIDSPLVDLFELIMPNGTTYYFHPGLDDDLTDVQFRAKTYPHITKTYNAIPMEMSGMELASEGVSNRPELSIANVTSDLKNTVGITNYKELVGASIVRRQTFKKFLVGESQDIGPYDPPIELNSVKYSIDRVSAETNIFVTFELAAVYDLQGISIPRRLAVGKFCSWQYQGHVSGGVGGCTWLADGFTPTYQLVDPIVSYNHYLYFDVDDTPLIMKSWLTNGANAPVWWSGEDYTQSSYVEFPSGTDNWYRAEKVHTSQVSNRPDQNSGHWLKVKHWETYNAATTYSKGDLVKHSALDGRGTVITTIWKALVDSITGETPSFSSAYWEREEMCGKKLSSCKCRFQATFVNPNSTQSAPTSKKDTTAVLPFGAFPGSNRY